MTTPTPDFLRNLAAAERMVYKSQGYPMFVSYELDDQRNPTVERWRYHDAENQQNDGDGWIIITVREVAQTQHSGILVIFHQQRFAPDGEPLSRGKRHVVGLTSFKRLVKRHRAAAFDDLADDMEGK